MVLIDDLWIWVLKWSAATSIFADQIQAHNYKPSLILHNIIVLGLHITIDNFMRPWFDGMQPKIIIYKYTRISTEAVTDRRPNVPLYAEGIGAFDRLTNMIQCCNSTTDDDHELSLNQCIENRIVIAPPSIIYTYVYTYMNDICIRTYLDYTCMEW
jgi:hypothetical protein